MYTFFIKNVLIGLPLVLLLQSCGNSNLGIVEPGNADELGDEINKTTTNFLPLTPINKQIETKKIITQEINAPLIDGSCEAWSTLATISPYAHSKALSGPVHGGTCSRPPALVAARIPMVPTIRLVQSRSELSLKYASTYVATQLQHAVSGESSLDVRHEAQQKWAALPPTLVEPSEFRKQPYLSLTSTAHPVQSVSKLKTDDTIHQSLSRVPFVSDSAKSFYPIATGYHVCFEAHSGVWLAKVQDGWGRMQMLPVVFSPDQSPTQALQKLAAKSPDQQKYWVHVLKTDQLTWASKVVYVGTLGVRGGGNSASSGADDSVGSSDRRDFDHPRNDRRGASMDLLTVSVEPSSSTVHFGPSNRYTDSMASDAVNKSMHRARETQHYGSRVDTSVSSGFNSYTPRTSGSGINMDAFYRANANASRAAGFCTNMDASHGANTNTSTVDEPLRTSEHFERNCDRSSHRSSRASAFPGDTSSFQSRESTSFGTGYNFPCYTSPHASFARNSTGRQYRHQAPRRSSQDDHKSSQSHNHTVFHEEKARTHIIEELSKQAHFRWMEDRLTGARESSNTCDLEGRKEGLDTMYCGEEERIKQEAAREREECGTRFEETNYREKQRINQEKSHKVSARSNTGETPSAVQTPAACTQAASAQQDKEVRNENISAVPTSVNTFTPDVESHAAIKLGNQKIDSAVNRSGLRKKNEIFNVPATPATAPSASRDASSAVAPSIGHFVSSAVSISKAQEEEDRKMPASISGREQQIQESVKAYIAKWQEAKPSERLTLQSKDQAILEQLEALKKDTKREYRKHMMGVDAPDVDPWVWGQSFQRQRATKAQLNELRSMRGELIEKLQPTENVLRAAGMDVACNESREKVCYSSDEDEFPFPPLDKADRKKEAKPVFQAYPVKQMQVSQKGVVAITAHEGFREKVYKVGGRGGDTIGYGHEVLPGEIFSQGVTKDQALDLLDKDIQKALKDVQAHVKVPLKQHQLDALVSYVYNTGSLHNSRLINRLNAGDFLGAAREMDIITQGRVVKLQGLVNRREAEQKLFLYGYDD
ncbi:MAG: lysozyme [Amoebophilaceae bacterium]|nr:lysozyme [Amoebophilaceae bacterium]